MAISVFDLFKIGIGPSSSHTVGPMRAANQFLNRLKKDNVFDQTFQVKTELFGSLGATGKGHGSDTAVLLGLEGHEPDIVDPSAVSDILLRIRHDNKLCLNGVKMIDFNEPEDLILHKRKSLPFHPNGMRIIAFNEHGETICQRDYYSVGGGFVVDEDAVGADRIKEDDTQLSYPYSSAKELLELCNKHGLRICDLMLENEKAWRSEQEIRSELLKIWRAMKECVSAGIQAEGILPGGMKVKRRAKRMHQLLISDTNESPDPLSAMDWVNLYALAVNEQNAAGGRVVTAPTNGAAGIVPAVLHYYANYYRSSSDDNVIRFLLTAGAIGTLYKMNASISGAEVGCQGEVGSACSMAAAGLAEVLNGTVEQIENAAEIAMEHNLGLTCDPVGGLVQVPCIERNAIASTKAINAARMAMRGDGTHFVSLDQVIKTMRETGADMKTKYKETARGGLAVNVIEC